MKRILSFFMLFFVLMSNAQNIGIVIELNDGSTREGQIKGWGNQLWGFNKITYKVNGKSENVAIKDVARFTVYEPDDIRNFEKIKGYRNFNNKRVDKNDLYAEVLYSGENIILYYGHYGMEWTDARFYCLRKEEKIASIVSFIFANTKNQVFKRQGAAYFADYPELSEKMKSGEYTYKDIVKVVRLYDQWVSSQ